MLLYEENHILKEKITMKKFISRLLSERHHLVTEERYVIETLDVIDEQHKWYIDKNLNVVKSKVVDQPNQWKIHFNASRKQWMSIISKLSNKGFILVIKNARYVHLLKGNET